jgi:hypothetical protein
VALILIFPVGMNQNTLGPGFALAAVFNLTLFLSTSVFYHISHYEKLLCVS